MVSFHSSLLPSSTMLQDCDDSLKKRKRDGSLQLEDFSDHLPANLSKRKDSKRPILDNEFHVETPMPLEWQRCLDIKSGQIYYYNIKTHKKTSRDPREASKNMSLDLELNLPCGSSSDVTNVRKHHVADNFTKASSCTTSFNKNITGGGGEGLSWLALEGGDGDQQQEMVTAVCKKCHMLVMMFKNSPSCPNCKFMHPPNQTPPSLFNRELRLLC